MKGETEAAETLLAAAASVPDDGRVTDFALRRGRRPTALIYATDKWRLTVRSGGVDVGGPERDDRAEAEADRGSFSTGRVQRLWKVANSNDTLWRDS